MSHVYRTIIPSQSSSPMAKSIAFARPVPDMAEATSTQLSQSRAMVLLHVVSEARRSIQNPDCFVVVVHVPS